MIEISKEVERIAKKQINKRKDLEYIKNSDVRIAYLVSDEEKKSNRKIVYADCTKVSKRYAAFCPYDFFITVYTQNCCEFTEEQMDILLTHELYHVGIDDSGNDVKYYIVPHDIEEFEMIINENGLNWQRSVK